MFDEALAVAGIRAKVERARVQYEGFDPAFKAFTDPHPYTIVRSHEPGCVRGYLSCLEPIPVEWSVWLGELVHNLHSALDHTVYALAAILRGGVVNGTAFPIFTDHALFSDTGPRGAQRLIKHIPNQARDYIERVQPFHGHTTVSHCLNSLHMLWNQDKHRVIQPWGFFMDPDWKGMRIVPPACNLVVNHKVARHGAVMFTIEPPVGVQPNHVTLEGEFTLHVAFDDPADPAGRFGYSIPQLINSVATVVDDLLGMIERPV